jgi:hypothetical protein
MIKVGLTFASLVLVVSAPAARAASGQGQKKPAQTVATKTGARSAAAEQPKLKLSEAEERLVRGSKDAIIAAGISESYFDEHFTLSRVFNAPGDRRVVWRFRVNGHEALVNDTVGFYTAANGVRVDTHSIASALASAHDITRTITRRRAERIMRSCIGPFNGGAVVYHMAGEPERASLIFTATSIPRRKSRAELAREERERERREEREREARERAAKRNGQTVSPQHDELEDEDEGGGAPMFIGAVDLETGRCTKGRAQAGPPRPEKR